MIVTYNMDEVGGGVVTVSLRRGEGRHLRGLGDGSTRGSWGPGLEKKMLELNARGESTAEWWE